VPRGRRDRRLLRGHGAGPGHAGAPRAARGARGRDVMTDDLREALVRLSERGRPAGIESLVERIDAEVGPSAGRAAWPDRSRARVGHRRPWILATAMTVALVLVAAGILLVAGSGSETSDRQVGSAELAPERLQVALRAPVPSNGQPVTHLTTAGGSLWATV